MSNPNVDLGKWLINEVLKINPSELITYELLEQYGIDSVMIEKLWDIENRAPRKTMFFECVPSWNLKFVAFYESKLSKMLLFRGSQ